MMTEIVPYTLSYIQSVGGNCHEQRLSGILNFYYCCALISHHHSSVQQFTISVMSGLRVFTSLCAKLLYNHLSYSNNQDIIEHFHRLRQRIGLSYGVYPQDVELTWGMELEFVVRYDLKPYQHAVF